MNKAPSTLRNLKTIISLWKCIKCFPSTLCRRNWKRRFLSDAPSTVTRIRIFESATFSFRIRLPSTPSYPANSAANPDIFASVWTRKCYESENNLKSFGFKHNRIREDGAWKRISCFPSTLRRRDHWSYRIWVWERLEQENHIVIATSSFSKSFLRFNKMFSSSSNEKPVYLNFSGLKRRVDCRIPGHSLTSHWIWCFIFFLYASSLEALRDISSPKSSVVLVTE